MQLIICDDVWTIPVAITLKFVHFDYTCLKIIKAWFRSKSQISWKELSFQNCPVSLHTPHVYSKPSLKLNLTLKMRKERNLQVYNLTNTKQV